jgi:hypothetical protein
MEGLSCPFYILLAGHTRIRRSFLQVLLLVCVSLAMGSLLRCRAQNGPLSRNAQFSEY